MPEAISTIHSKLNSNILKQDSAIITNSPKNPNPEGPENTSEHDFRFNGTFQTQSWRPDNRYTLVLSIFPPLFPISMCIHGHHEGPLTSARQKVRGLLDFFFYEFPAKASNTEESSGTHSVDRYLVHFVGPVGGWKQLTVAFGDLFRLNKNKNFSRKSLKSPLNDSSHQKQLSISNLHQWQQMKN